jgi:hypothetical protein
MGEYLQGNNLKANFLQYIADVIKHYTPKLQPHPPGGLPNNWYDFLFGNNELWESYGRLIGNLCNLGFREATHTMRGYYSDIKCETDPDPKFQYSIITLNYDLIPESIVD